MRSILLALLLGTGLYAQENPGDKFVTVPQKFVSEEGLKHQADVADTASKYIGLGREIGVATREGLNSVVDVAQKFGGTNVGRFVMVMIAWRIMGHDLLGVILGVPILIAGVSIWLYAAKRLFFGYRVLERKEGHIKFYTDHAPYQFQSGDAKAGIGVFMMGSLVAFVLTLLFAVIF